MKHIFFKPDKPLLFAHRGASSIAPENTKISFEKAVETGCRGIELDVHLTLDRNLVVIHDSTLTRTCRVFNASTGLFENPPSSRVEDMTLNEIKQYDAGIWFSKEFEGQKVQTLEEVLDSLNEDIYVDIEMKSSSFFCKLLAYKTAQVLESRNKDKYMVSSFNPASILYFKQKSSIPSAIIYAFNDEVPFYLRRGQGRFLCGADILKPAWQDYKVPFTKNGQYEHLERNLESIKKGRPVSFWTVDDPDLAQLLVNSGAAGIITNKPQVLVNLACFT